MISTLAISQANDIYAINGRLVSKSGQDAIAQNCKTAMQARRNEMQYAFDQGVPYFETAFTGSPNMLAFEAAARTTLKRVAGVLEVVSFAASIASGTLVYTATIRTIYGVTALNGNV